MYGTPRTITTDKDNPNIEKGVAYYMDESTYERFYSFYTTIGHVCFVSGILGILLYSIFRFLRYRAGG